MDDDVLLDRLSRLDLNEKVRLLTGADSWGLHPLPAIGLRRMVLSDGPAGVRGEVWDDRFPSANVPSPTALAASWDEPLVTRIGELLSAEARSKSVDVLLAPTVNLHRTPYGGRHFECFSEDPLLTGRIGVAFVRGVQAGGVGATVKHFVANDSETDRFSADVRVDERTLREVYLAPFEAITVEGGAWAVMAAYNAVNGTTCTEHPLLAEVLKGEWGFDGVVMSDWFAARTTAPAGRAVLDLAMPGPTGPWGPALVEAVEAGEVPLAAVDAKVLSLLRLAGRVGAFDGVEPAVTRLPPPVDDVPGLLRSAAAAGFVLARNEPAAGAQQPLLPLTPEALTSVAVIGPDALTGRTLGGGSATVFPPYTVSPVDGLRSALPGVEVTHALGVRAHTRLPVAQGPLAQLPDGSGPGVEVRFLDAGGAVLATEQRRSGAFIWMDGFGPGLTREQVSAIEVRMRVVAQDAGDHAVGLSGVGRYELWVDGEQVVDEQLSLAPGADPVEAMMAPPQAAHVVPLGAGEGVDVVVRHQLGELGTAFAGGLVAFQVNVEPPFRGAEAELAAAVAAAAAADVAVVVVGTTEEVESEGFDRDSLALPGDQDALVSAVLQANQRTVVVVNSGAPVLMPWLDDVPATLLIWFPGQELGNALADVLLGAVEPGGRLPTTWPAADGGLSPSTAPVDGRLDYSEGLHVGHRAYLRAGVEPALPFGHGLGYTTWSYGEATVSATADGALDLGVVVRNTGGRAGREVVQVYASREASAVERPVRWLAGFATVDVGAGEDVTARITLQRRAFEHWADGGWALEPGEVTLHVGRSVSDVRTTVRAQVPTTT
jgi:beta-glucosidase